MTAQDASLVWQWVWRRMGEWEADGGAGSAWPVFARAWREALQQRPPSEPATSADREEAWRRWLEGGPDSTPASRTAQLAAARLRAKGARLFGFDAAREPGEEG